MNYENAKAHTKVDCRRSVSSPVAGIYLGVYRLLEVDERV